MEAILADRIERAAQAAALMREDSIFSEALAGVEAAYMGQWRAASDAETREDIHRKVHLLEQIRTELVNMIVTGSIEAEAQEQAKKGFSLWPM